MVNTGVQDITLEALIKTMDQASKGSKGAVASYMHSFSFVASGSGFFYGLFDELSLFMSIFERGQNSGATHKVDRARFLQLYSCSEFRKETCKGFSCLVSCILYSILYTLFVTVN